MNTKQVIVIRKDLNMRTGKKMAMSAHASMAFLSKKGTMQYHTEYGMCDYTEYFFKNNSMDMKENWSNIDHWLKNSFRKICVYVNSEEELKEVYQKALDKGLMSNLVEDNGTTEFNGVKTLTCCAIGPHWDNDFIGITDHLPLL